MSFKSLSISLLEQNSNTIIYKGRQQNPDTKQYNFHNVQHLIRGKEARKYNPKTKPEKTSNQKKSVCVCLGKQKPKKGKQKINLGAGPVV